MLRRYRMLLRTVEGDTTSKPNPEFLFFTGKGGVGKTSMACATAVQLAEEWSSSAC